jgi:hypothetical protein
MSFFHRQLNAFQFLRLSRRDYPKAYRRRESSRATTGKKREPESRIDENKKLSCLMHGTRILIPIHLFLITKAVQAHNGAWQGFLPIVLRRWVDDIGVDELDFRVFTSQNGL